MRAAGPVARRPRTAGSAPREASGNGGGRDALGDQAAEAIGSRSAGWRGSGSAAGGAQDAAPAADPAMDDGGRGRRRAALARRRPLARTAESRAPVRADR